MAEYTIHTDLTQDELSIVGRALFNEWVAFALGQESLGGRVIEHPSGSYASSIKMTSAPGMIVVGSSSEEANIIEFGHAPIDMLAHLRPKTTYPIKRFGKPTIFARTPTDPGQRAPSNTSGTGPGWTIPPMTAYSPAKILADLYRITFGAK